MERSIEKCRNIFKNQNQLATLEFERYSQKVNVLCNIRTECVRTIFFFFFFEGQSIIGQTYLKKLTNSFILRLVDEGGDNIFSFIIALVSRCPHISLSKPTK